MAAVILGGLSVAAQFDPTGYSQLAMVGTKVIFKLAKAGYNAVNSDGDDDDDDGDDDNGDGKDGDDKKTDDEDKKSKKDKKGGKGKSKKHDKPNSHFDLTALPTPWRPMIERLTSGQSHKVTEAQKRAYETVNFVVRNFGSKVMSSGIFSPISLEKALANADEYIEVSLSSEEANRLFRSLAKKSDDQTLVNSTFASIYLLGALTAELSNCLPDWKPKYPKLGPKIVQQLFIAAIGEDAYKMNAVENEKCFEVLANTAALLRPTDIGYSVFPGLPNLIPTQYSTSKGSANLKTCKGLIKHFEKNGFPQPIGRDDVGAITDWRFLNGHSNSREVEVEKADKQIGEDFGKVLYWLICAADRMAPGQAVIVYFEQHISLVKWLASRFDFRVLSAETDLDMSSKENKKMDKKNRAMFNTWMLIMPPIVRGVQLPATTPATPASIPTTPAITGTTAAMASPPASPVLPQADEKHATIVQTIEDPAAAHAAKAKRGSSLFDWSLGFKKKDKDKKGHEEPAEEITTSPVPAEKLAAVVASQEYPFLEKAVIPEPSHAPAPPPVYSQTSSPPMSPSDTPLSPTTSRRKAPPLVKKKLVYAKAIGDFNAEGGDELAFQEGDSVIVVDQCADQEGWWKVKIDSADGKEGFVPSGYFELVAAA